VKNDNQLHANESFQNQRNEINKEFSKIIPFKNVNEIKLTNDSIQEYLKEKEIDPELIRVNVF
jgi:hypothetical protein